MTRGVIKTGLLLTLTPKLLLWMQLQMLDALLIKSIKRTSLQQGEEKSSLDYSPGDIVTLLGLVPSAKTLSSSTE